MCHPDFPRGEYKYMRAIVSSTIRAVETGHVKLLNDSILERIFDSFDVTFKEGITYQGQYQKDPDHLRPHRLGGMR